jgi:hypothetical protein
MHEHLTNDCLGRDISYYNYPTPDTSLNRIHKMKELLYVTLCVLPTSIQREKGQREKFRNTPLLYIYKSNIALEVSKTFRNTEHYIGNPHERNHTHISTSKENRIIKGIHE